MFLSGYYRTAELKIKNETQVAEAIEALLELCAITRSEPGCRLFMLHQDLQDKRRLLLWEQWDDEAALAKHLESPYTKAYFARDLTEALQNIGTAAAQ